VLVVLLLSTTVLVSAHEPVQTPVTAPVAPFMVDEATIADVRAAFASGELTCRQLVDTYLARIDKYDQHGPALNAIASINPLARDEADRLDRVYAERGPSGPLHCVPMIVKDNISTEGWETNAGSLALRGFIPDRDATAILRLKAAGAIILAKSNMSDLALNALTTVNRIHGRTKNPYALDRVPAGSSGGTAVAIAANLGLVGLGTDTGNSVRGPAAHTSIVGLRPTMGLTSRTGTIPLDRLSDVIGPMARSVDDVAEVLMVLTGFDPEDPATEAVREAPGLGMPANFDAPVAGIRVGVLRQAYEGDPLQIDKQIARTFGQALQDLTELGVIVVEDVTIAAVPPVAGAEECRGLKYDLDEFLATQGDRVPVHSLDQIIASRKFDPSIESDLREMSEGRHEGPGSAACAASVEYRTAMGAALTEAMDSAQLDALVYPTWSQPPQYMFSYGPEGAGQTLRFATAAGFPAITVPMGYTDKVLPAGLSMLGRAWSEAQLLRIAHAYEQATHHRHPPSLTPPLGSGSEKQKK
jgi:Asp-tRNA(Asn)/Glu-tRNA(Gln) amidotransferase A subunit family amidase